MGDSAEHQDKLEAWTVDDSEFDRKLNRRILIQSGAFTRIEEFPSAQDALDALRTRTSFPDVIFLDVMMPVKSGFDFLAEATEEFGEAFTSRVVIMLTSSLNPDDVARAEQFKAVQKLRSKPLTVSDVKNVAETTSKLGNRN